MSFLISGLTALITFIIEYFGRTALKISSVLTAFIFITAALLVCFKQFIAILYGYSAPPQFITSILSIFLTTKTMAALSTVISARSCKAAYMIAVEKLKMISAS